jgi:hypothetical protein
MNIQMFLRKTAILESQSEASDIFYFLGYHWLRSFVRFHNQRIMVTSSLAAAVAAASPVPLPKPPGVATDSTVMLDPALPDTLLDTSNLANLELAFPGNDFALLWKSAQELVNFETPVWPTFLPSIQNEIVTQIRKAAKPDLPELLKAMILLATEQLDQSKRLAQQVADEMNHCGDLNRKAHEVHQGLDVLLQRLSKADESNNVMAFPYRLSVQQMLTRLPAQATLIVATGKAANDPRARRKNLPVIIMGDFNDVPDADLQFAHRVRKYPTKNNLINALSTRSLDVSRTIHPSIHGNTFQRTKKTKK